MDLFTIYFTLISGFSAFLLEKPVEMSSTVDGKNPLVDSKIITKHCPIKEDQFLLKTVNVEKVLKLMISF